MISSMTGFGQAVAEIDGVVYTVEIRSVNNRYFKASVRVPEIASFLEDELEKSLRNLVFRGSVNYSLRMKNVSENALFDIDEATLRSYLNRLEKIADSSPAHNRIDLASLLSLPGIVQPKIPGCGELEKIQNAVLTLTAQAVEKLKQSRLEEGRILTEDMLSQCEMIREKLQVVQGRYGTVIQEYHEKLQKRVDDLLARAQLKIDSDLLAREVAIYAERSDVAEEVLRLQTHIDQFSACCKSGGAVGRRLDFVAQEMLREANTIASKSGDSLIGQCVIDIKCAVDRIKEQVQNIE